MSNLLSQLPYTDLFLKIRAALPLHSEIYLVGGAIRDLLSGRKIHDLDFVLSSNSRVIPASRRVAHALNAAFYPLDSQRDTARLILTQADGARLFLDFAAFRGEDIENDLRARDFTVNAIAINLDQPGQLIDPLQGVKDIFQNILRACSDDSLLNDPLRIIRGVRLSIQCNYQITTQTQQLMRQAITGLSTISPERMRDELLRILNNQSPETAIRALDVLGALSYILPELPALKNIQQGQPHILDVWDHTLSVVQKLGQILSILDLELNLDETGNLVSGWISLRLGRFRHKIADHLSQTLSPEHPIRSLLCLAALYHDAGKSQRQSVDTAGKIHFYQHETISQQMVEARAQSLRLSNQEVKRVGAIVGGHMRPILLSHSSEPPTRRAIYRFWRDLEDAGVDVCLLSLADLLGTYGPTLPPEQLERHLNTIRVLLDAWWEHRQEQVQPPRLVSGRLLMKELDLKPGPILGELLEAIRQTQVEGLISDQEQALAFARQWLENPTPVD